MEAVYKEHLGNMESHACRQVILNRVVLQYGSRLGSRTYMSILAVLDRFSLLLYSCHCDEVRMEKVING